MPKNNLKLADEFAADYDNSILKNNWNGPKIVFNLIRNQLNSNSEILDLGIGTGESSKSFQNAGHKIVGLDGSEKMLNECRKKKIGSEWIVHNMQMFPFPLKNKQFDAVISNGVFHLIHPLKPVFSEVKRIVKPDGLFAFTYENAENTTNYTKIESGVWKMKTKTGVDTYMQKTIFPIF